MISGLLRGVGIFIIVVMIAWIATTNTAPNEAVGRVILGFVMIAVAYLMDIKQLLEKQSE